MKKLILITGFMLLTASLTFSQEVVIEGVQKLGTNPKNSEMISDPVTINKTMSIVRVEGDFGCFWLTGSTESGENVTYQYTDKNSAVGQTLEAGMYFVFPNLNPGSKIASVKVYLKPQ